MSETNSSGERLYIDLEGSKCNIRGMIRKEPEWVAIRFTAMEDALDAKDAKIAKLKADNDAMLQPGGYDYFSKRCDELQQEVSRLSNATDMLVKERKQLEADLAEARGVVERLVSNSNQAEYDSGPLVAELPWQEIVSARVFLYGDPDQAQAAASGGGA